MGADHMPEAPHGNDRIEPRPTVGRIVHYFDTRRSIGNTGPFAAIITGVGDSVVTLWVFFPVPGEYGYHTDVPYVDHTPLPRYWAWPPREG